VREKPKKAQSLDYGLLGGPEGEEEEKKMPVGASAPMSELARVLKKGIATPLKPRVGEPSSEFVVVGTCLDRAITIPRFMYPMPVFTLPSTKLMLDLNLEKKGELPAEAWLHDALASLT